MRRLALAAGCAAGLGAIALLAWRWWSAPPAESPARLGEALAIVPASADGALAIAEAPRATRWLALHPQALALLAAAAPRAVGAASRLTAVSTSLATAARDSVVVWWRGDALAIAARTDPGAARALTELAALKGVPASQEPAGDGLVLVRVATAAELLESGPAAVVPELPDHALGALGRVGSRWWRARLGRSWLDATTGAPVELPALTRPGRILTADAGALLAPAVPGVTLPRVPLAAALDRGEWALGLPGVHLSRDVVRALTLGGDEPAPPPAAARRWRGVLGTLWAIPGDGVTIASRADLLTAVTVPTGQDEASFTGADAAALAERLAGAVEGAAALGVPVHELRRAARLAAGLTAVRWRLTPDGGRIRLEW